MKYILFILVFVIVGCSIFENNDIEKKTKAKTCNTGGN
jgi:Na+-transporting methylmalonyl-CoA/oxaloacetate decarboxylase gamma subunit